MTLLQQRKSGGNETHLFTPLQIIRHLPTFSISLSHPKERNTPPPQVIKQTAGLGQSQFQQDRKRFCGRFCLTEIEVASFVIAVLRVKYVSLVGELFFTYSAFIFCHNYKKKHITPLLIEH